MDDTIGAALTIATLFKEKKENYVIVSNNLYSAEKTYDFLLNFLPEEEVVFFPADELLRAESLTSSRELLAQRLYGLGRLLDKKSKKVLICHPSSLLRFLPDPARFGEECIHFSVGKEFNLPQLKEKLVEMGYQGINKVEHSLQFASRGDILDIYSVSYLDPIRIEFFGDEIDSIRTFDIATQQSKEKLKDALVLPATDIFLNDDELSSFMERANQQLQKDKGLLSRELGDLLDSNVGIDLERFVSRDYRPSLYKYFGYALGKKFNVLDYFTPKLIYVANKQSFVSNCDLLIREARDYFNDLRIKTRLLSHLEEYMDVEDALKGKGKTVYGQNFVKSPNDFTLLVKPIVMTGRSLVHVVPTIQTYLATEEKVVLSLKERQQIDTVSSLLDEAKIPYEMVEGFDLPKGKLGITKAFLNEGFDLQQMGIAYLSQAEVFGSRAISSRFTSRFKDATILRSYEDLHPGDYIVHEYNGIGQYLGVKTIEQDGIHRDYLHIAYAANESLYVPLEQFRLVRKYAGREGAAPKLSHLNSAEWEK
ncbi:MAG: hypothetical protein J6038_03850, partial [Bacilli bacterium]|nr:hypothetical protein [Bacilli bacterium]